MEITNPFNLHRVRLKRITPIKDSILNASIIFRTNILAAIFIEILFKTIRNIKQSNKKNDGT